MAIRSINGETFPFKVKRSTRISKVIGVYCDKLKIDLSDYSFLFDGRRIYDEYETIASLRIQPGDCIDVIQNACGC